MGKRKAGTVTLKIGGPQDYEQVADRVAEHTKETVLKALQTATKPQDLVDAEKEYQETRERSHEEALKLAKKQKTDWKPHASAFTLICAAGTDSLAFNIQGKKKK